VAARGKKGKAAIDEWLKDVAPGDELRKTDSFSFSISMFLCVLCD